MTRGSKSMRWRAVAILVLGLMLGSVGSGVGTAAVGLTKKKADKKFLQNTTIVQQTFTANNMQATPMSVNCPPGLQAVGGGADSPALLAPMGSDIMIAPESRPIQSGARSVGWYVEAIGAGTGTNVTVYAVCSK